MILNFKLSRYNFFVIWGGLNQLLIEEPNNSDVVQQILLYARISPISVFGYDCVYIFVKKPKASGQPAEVRHISTVEASQRLNAENLNHAYIVGLFEGDGYFTVSKKRKVFSMWSWHRIEHKRCTACV